jgi:hypothetical protein
MDEIRSSLLEKKWRPDIVATLCGVFLMKLSNNALLVCISLHCNLWKKI